MVSPMKGKKEMQWELSNVITFSAAMVACQGSEPETYFPLPWKGKLADIKAVLTENRTGMRLEGLEDNWKGDTFLTKD